jgi:hypothetical protein
MLKLCAIPMLGALLYVSSCAAAERRCSQDEATAADAIVEQLDSWPKLDAAVKRYGHCDDGSVAEGNSEAVARLLVDRWKTLPQLVQLARKRPGLRSFVLRHVDSTLNTSDLERVAWLATHACPAGVEAMCGDLDRAASAALRAQTR